MKANEAINTQISRTLKASRKERGWSLDKTAQQTGVSKAMLGQIERQESSPTIATLWKIATGLQCSFSSFLIPGAAGTDVSTAPTGETGFSADSNMKVKTLFPYSPITRSEMFEITLTDFHEQLSTPHQSGVLEHIHVIEGQLEILQQETWHPVGAGEQFLLSADREHGYRDLSGKTRFIDMIFYP